MVQGGSLSIDNGCPTIILSWTNFPIKFFSQMKLNTSADNIQPENDESTSHPYSLKMQIFEEEVYEKI